MTHKTHEVLFPEILKGVHAGALAAIEQARRTGTKLVIWRDDKIVEITAEDADAMLLKRKQQEGS